MSGRGREIEKEDSNGEETVQNRSRNECERVALLEVLYSNQSCIYSVKEYTTGNDHNMQHQNKLSGPKNSHFRHILLKIK